MASYWYDEADASYKTSSTSDSRWNESYLVSYEPREAKYYCECPAYQFNAPLHCKHIQREWEGLYEHAISSAQEALREAARIPAVDSAEDTTLVSEEAPASANTYSVSMNGNAPRVMERSMLDWLCDALLEGDSISVRRA